MKTIIQQGNGDAVRLGVSLRGMGDRLVLEVAGSGNETKERRIGLQSPSEADTLIQALIDERKRLWPWPACEVRP